MSGTVRSSKLRLKSQLGALHRTSRKHSQRCSWHRSVLRRGFLLRTVQAPQSNYFWSWAVQTSCLLPNNSFKPNLLRYVISVAEKACHAAASTTQVGLTQALGPKKLFKHWRSSSATQRGHSTPIDPASAGIASASASVALAGLSGIADFGEFPGSTVSPSATNSGFRPGTRGIIGRARSARLRFKAVGLPAVAVLALVLGPNNSFKPKPLRGSA
jgi:hypothetical protein